MQCNVCGYELSQNARFCKNCGAVVTQQVYEEKLENSETDFTGNEYIAPQDSLERKNKGLVVALIIVSSVLVVLIFAGILLLAFGNTEKEAETDGMVYEENVIKEEVAEKKVDEEPVSFDRTITYSAAYKYKDMSGIYNSVEASDSEAVELKYFIENYNRCWEEYVNFSNPEIYNYLRKGTVAYRYTSNFDKTGLSEEFELVDVEDVRKSGNTYYVWVHEKIRKIRPDDETVKTYHWVYKVGKDDGGRYVESYTADPYYN